MDCLLFACLIFFVPFASLMVRVSALMSFYLCLIRFWVTRKMEDEWLGLGTEKDYLRT